MFWLRNKKNIILVCVLTKGLLEPALKQFGFISLKSKIKFEAKSLAKDRCVQCISI